MKNHFLSVILLLALAVSGCSHLKPQPKAVPPAVAAQPIVTPDTSLAAKVISVNTVGRFVVLNFPDGALPKLQQALFIYHAGLKTAEVKITGPQQGNNIVADMTSGDARVGDTVRDQ